MLISVETGVQSFRVEQKYNAAKPSSAGRLLRKNRLVPRNVGRRAVTNKIVGI
jgi:hypothetical protein